MGRAHKWIVTLGVIYMDKIVRDSPVNIAWSYCANSSKREVTRQKRISFSAFYLAQTSEENLGLEHHLVNTSYQSKNRNRIKMTYPRL